MYPPVDCQEPVTQPSEKELKVILPLSQVPATDRGKDSGIDQKVNKEKFKEWQSFKSRLHFTGFSPSKNQKWSLQQSFVASIPTPNPRTLEKPPAHEEGLLAFFEQASHIAIPRRPLPTRTITNMGKMAAVKKGKAAVGTRRVNGNEREEANIAVPVTPEPTTNGDSDDADDSEAESTEPVTPVASQAKGKKKAPEANMTEKPTSNGGTKRTSDGEAKDVKKPTPKKKAAPGADNASQAAESSAPPVRPATSNDAIAFASPSFDIYVGSSKYQFSAHQAILAQSPVLEKLCAAQANKKGRAKTYLLMPKESPANFAALLTYLYSGKVLLNIPIPTNEDPTVEVAAATVGNEVIVRTAKKLAKLYCVGATYELAELQNYVTNLLHETKLWEKLPGMEFFELAERLYPEDPDEADGDSFAKFFADHAPAMIKTVPENRLSELMRMVSSGGAFAEAIFVAYNAAARAGTSKAPKPKVEEKVVQGVGAGVNGGVKEGVNEEQRDAGHEDRDEHRDKRSKAAEGDAEGSKGSGSVFGNGGATEDGGVPANGAVAETVSTAIES